MRTTKYMLLLGLTAMSLGSCKKFLDVQPVNQIGESEALNTEDKLQRALNGAYSRLQVNEYYGFEWSNAIWLSDDNVVPFSSGTTDLQFDGHAVLASSNTMDITWRAMYQAINAANNVIDGASSLQATGFTEEERNNMLGQAYFIRALVYFDLVRTWGGVPLVLQPTRGLNSSSYPARSSAADVYTQIEKDLLEAEAKLPVSSTRNIATRMAATALKARLYLYQEKWSAAEQAATTVINAQSTYSLVKPFEKLITDKLTSEAIFELDYNATDGNSLASVFLPQALGGSYRVGPTNELVDLLNDENTGGSRNVLVGVSGTAPYGNKYRRVGAGRNDDNVTILRLAEMYLIRAEARAHQDKIAEGLADLNLIRNRAGLNDAIAAADDELLLLIEQERRLEFAFEPHRWFDLIRTNRAGAVLGVTDTKKYVFPIPANEVLTNTNLIQNEGY